MTEHRDPAPALLARFRASDAALVGEGGESRVFALDGERVLRVYRQGTREAVARRVAFAEELAEAGLPFAVPAVLEWGKAGRAWYSVEPRLDGRTLGEALTQLTPAERRRALERYVDAAIAIREARFTRPYFGEVLADAPLRRERWPDFLIARVTATLDRSRRDLAADAPDVDLARLTARFASDASALAMIDAPALVHGDFFPGNVLVDATGTVSAVIDFSALTLAGDARLDAVGALVFLDVRPGATGDEREFVRAALADRDPGFADVVDLYRAYYALRFSFTKSASPRLYAWCLAGLRALAARW